MMRKLYIGLILFTFFLGTGDVLSQELNPEAIKLYNSGNKLLKEGDFTGAADQYDKALAIQKDYRIYYQKGVALSKSGNNEQAVTFFEQSVKLKPDFEQGYTALAGTYYTMGDYASAATNFEKLLGISKNESLKPKIKENLAIAYTKLANEEMKKGTRQKAESHFQKAVELNNFDAAYLGLADLYSESGDNDKAIEAAQNALKHRNAISKGGPYYYMGVAYKNKGDNDKAKEMFNLAKSDPAYKKLVDYELSLLQK